MMLQLGVAAPIAALVAWLLFGAVLGATASSRHGDQSGPALDASASGGSGTTRARLTLVVGPIVAIVTLVIIAYAVTGLSAAPSRPSATGTQTIATSGATTLFVLDGRIAVQPPGGSPTQIGPSGSTLVQPGASVQVANAGDGAAHFLRFAVTATPPGS